MMKQLLPASLLFFLSLESAAAQTAAPFDMNQERQALPPLSAPTRPQAPRPPPPAPPPPPATPQPTTPDPVARPSGGPAAAPSESRQTPAPPADAAPQEASPSR